MSEAATAPAIDTRAVRPGVFRAALRSPEVVVSTLVVLLIVVAGLLAPLITPHDPDRSVLALVNAAPGTGGYLLGGDSSGRDIVSRLLASIDSMMLFATIATSVSIVVGVVFGLIAGYVGGLIDRGLSWVFDVIMAAPGLIVLIGVYAVFGGSATNPAPVIFGFMMAVGAYRLTRSLVISVRNELYVDAARVAGIPLGRLLARHILFVVRAPIVIQAAYAASTSIGVQAGLQFLGIGDANVPSWGGMLQQAFLNLYVNPLAILWPGLALTIIVSSLVLLGNGLRDVIEGPRRGGRLRRRPRTSGAASASASSGTVTSSAAPSGALLAIHGLSVAFPRGDGEGRRVVDDVTLEVAPGEVLGLVGESGAGKSQVAFAALGLLATEAEVVGGSIVLDGRTVVGRSEAELRTLRGPVVGYVPQEPLSNLDPSFTVGAQLVYGIRAGTGMSSAAARQRALDLLERVGIVDPPAMMRSYPHQISGGMAQRALIAGAVACDPKLLIADEPTTALDVTVQAEILDLIRDLQRERGMGVLIVTHNFGVVADICDRVAVMQDGRVVEQGEVRQVLRRPAHPYTRSLLSSMISETELRTPRRAPGSAAGQGSAGVTA